MTKVVILIFLGLLRGLISSQNVGNDKSCRNVVAQLNKLQMTQINSCANQLGFTTTKERLKKSTCILKCVLQSIGVINHDGSVSAAKLDQYIDDHFPSNLRQKAHTTFTPCLKLVQPSLSTPIGDEYCKSHDNFVKCMTRNFLMLCHQQ
ncbi:uncharacterized protein LOC110847463 [Folsomia candida]|uniref:uncharacterized protein LOC110847463 n=1 Tax=Folsomia candida TaxID=158441 RepID=UPI000B8FE074|nr:uncharacterized protein LOC110847463 [Folsomia candida]